MSRQPLLSAGNHFDAAIATDQRAFLLSFKAGGPDWALLGLNGVDQLPAVQWKAD
jgi:hypothetical protein